MVNIEITDELAAVLDAAASRAGLSKEQLAEEILSANVEDISLPLSAFTEEQLNRLTESSQQIKRGEYVTSEEVDRRFDAFFRRSASR
jgi:hypothetical protein